MIHYLLGAPGSGKSSIVAPLRSCLPDRIVLDWDALMGPAGELAGRPIPQSPQTWAPYGRLVRAVGEVILPAEMVLLGVCTPAELTDWPAGPWLLLDCSDDVRRQRLAARNDPEETAAALRDAHDYRSLGLPTLDTSQLSTAEVARAVAERILDVASGP